MNRQQSLFSTLSMNYGDRNIQQIYFDDENMIGIHSRGITSLIYDLKMLLKYIDIRKEYFPKFEYKLELETKNIDFKTYKDRKKLRNMCYDDKVKIETLIKDVKNFIKINQTLLPDYNHKEPLYTPVFTKHGLKESMVYIRNFDEQSINV